MKKVREEIVDLPERTVVLRTTIAPDGREDPAPKSQAATSKELIVEVRLDGVRVVGAGIRIDLDIVRNVLKRVMDAGSRKGGSGCRKRRSTARRAPIAQICR
jgi:hypothetical protein